jgi:glycosyltransferase involved in cell wall biosynthesis
VTEPTTPLISIVIPCYQQAQFLPDAIEGALAQTHRKIEVIVVDDGSPDSTAEVVARYPEVRCVQQQNRGVAEARNAGFRASSGEYVLFLDADDRLTPNAVETHLRCFAEHPEAGFVVGDIDQISSDGSYLRSPRWQELATNQYEQLLKVDHVANTVAVMFRRSVVETVGGFDGSYSPTEDYEILLRITRVFPGAQHRSVVAQYRRHDSNTSRKGALMLRQMSRTMQSQLSFVEGDPALKTAHRLGQIFWRDHYGGKTMQEILAHLSCGDLVSAARASAAVVWYARGRVFVIPWKYRKLMRETFRQVAARRVPRRGKGPV